MSDELNPYQAPQAAPRSSVGLGAELPYFKSWLIFFLITGVGGVLSGGILGAVLGATLASMNMSLQVVQIVTMLAGFIVALPISYFTYCWSVRTYLVEPLLRRT